MGRELKRVPLGFDWPLDKVWQGFINPHYKHCHDCQECAGSGSSPDMRRLKDMWYGYAPFRPEDRGSKPLQITDAPVRAFAERNIRQAPEFYGFGEAAIQREAKRLADMWNTQWSHHLNEADVVALIEAGRLMDFTHTFTPGTGWAKNESAKIPTPAEVNAWSLQGFGHDSINQWVVCGAEADRLGLVKECAACNGEGCIWDSAEAKAASEAWERQEPPIGAGYQIWETVSEGSPISPVFFTPEELARHMSNTTWGADKGTPYETWLEFIRGPGWAPTMMDTEGGLVTGVQAVGAGVLHD